MDLNEPDPTTGDSDPSRVALVLPGGGARGAYEAGALSILLPELERRGERVTIYCGTSVGAINGAALASVAQLGGAEQARLLLETWSQISKAAVTGRLIGPRLALGAARLAGEALGLPGVRFRGFIEAEPMRRNIDRWIDWEQLHENVDSGTVDAVCAVATSLRTGQPVGFVERASGTAPDGGAEEIHYAPVRLSGVHVRASAAIPTVFPAVEVPGDDRTAGFFVDGATRLNTPIRPAIDLGAERIIVVSFEPYAQTMPEAIGSPRPGFADLAANILDGTAGFHMRSSHRPAAANSGRSPSRSLSGASAACGGFAIPIWRSWPRCSAAAHPAVS